MDKVKLAAEAGAMPSRIRTEGPLPDYVARLDYAMMAALGVAPSINEAGERWGVSFAVARRLIDEGKRLTVLIADVEG